MKSKHPMAEEQEHVESPPITDWSNPPTIGDLRKDYQSANCL